ncbi:MAG: alginate export family protein [Desulfoarculaceae bacterium]|nr:alginate export family protein [Desulfoarculaceae bacterium]
MLKKISAVALAGLIGLPVLAGAGTDRVADLEKQMTEMTRMFNAQMEAMKAEISTLKTQNVEISKEIADNSEAAKKDSAALEWTRKIAMGGEVTFRGYNLQNVWDFDDTKDGDNRDLFRLKGSLWTTYQATDDVTAKIQLTNQTWGEGVTYDQSALRDPNDSAMDNNSNKVFLDNAYIHVKNLLELPVEATFGRQNVIYGSGFVLLDGQSQFASTSIYFDGVKLRWNISDQLMLDGLYMKDQENNVSNGVNNGAGDDITLSGFYFTNKKCPITGMQQELYALNRKDELLGKDIWMYGARLSDKMANGFDYSLEGAIQTGDATRDLDQDAYGLKLDAGYTFKDLTWTPRPYVNYSYLSGDGDAGDGDNKQWDVFYGGWPQWGDLLAWKFLNLKVNSTANVNNVKSVYDSFDDYSNVVGEAIYSNLQMITLGTSARIMPKLSANISYSLLSFNETDAGVDDDFGDYYQASLTYQYTKELSFSLYAAMIDPGKAFTDNDNATEVYWETKYKF